MTDIKVPTPVRVEIEWRLQWANSPEAIVYVDDAWDFPNPFENWGHHAVSDQLSLATEGIWAHFVYDATRPDQKSTKQFDGQCTGNLLLEDGSSRRVYSGWSSRASAINQFLDPEDYLVDVTLRGGAKYETLGRAGLAIRKDELEKLLPSGVYLVLGNKPYYFVPSIDSKEERKLRA